MSVYDLPAEFARYDLWPPVRATLYRCDSDFRQLKGAKSSNMAPDEKVSRETVAAECLRITDAGRSAEPGVTMWWKLLLVWPQGAPNTSSEHRWSTLDAPRLALVTAGMSRPALPPEVPAGIAAAAAGGPGDSTLALARLADVALSERRYMFEGALRTIETAGRVQAGVLEAQGDLIEVLREENRRGRCERDRLEARVVELEGEVLRLRGELDADPRDEEAASERRTREAMAQAFPAIGVPIAAGLAEHFAPGIMAKLGISADTAQRAVLGSIVPGEPLTATQAAVINAVLGATRPNGLATTGGSEGGH